MGKKDKTVSFRVNQDAFEALRAIADERDLSLSAVFRDYVDALVEHDGQVEVVPEGVTDDDEPVFPPRVTVPKSFVREHERLELEAEHLREQLDEYKRYVDHLHERLDGEDDDDVVFLEELDRERADPDRPRSPERSDSGFDLDEYR